MSLALPNRAASGVASGAGQRWAVAPFALLILVAARAVWSRLGSEHGRG